MLRPNPSSWLVVHLKADDVTNVDRGPRRVQVHCHPAWMGEGISSILFKGIPDQKLESGIALYRVSASWKVQLAQFIEFPSHTYMGLVTRNR